jgi:hypothetical protein
MVQGQTVRFVLGMVRRMRLSVDLRMVPDLLFIALFVLAEVRSIVSFGVILLPVRSHSICHGQ